ncbi:MAG: MerC domain-containing protein [Fimbriimonadaceae bacterium]
MRSINWDKWGAWAASVCAVHCVLTGVAMGVVSVLGLGFLADPTIERTFIALAVGFGAVALWSGFKKHESWVPAAIFGGGLVALAVKNTIFACPHEAVAGQAHVHEHGPGAVISAVVAGVLLVSFHALNIRLSHRCTCPACRPVDETESGPEQAPSVVR